MNIKMPMKYFGVRKPFTKQPDLVKIPLTNKCVVRNNVLTIAAVALGAPILRNGGMTEWH